MKKQITVTVNGTAHTLEVEPRLLLVHLIRETLSMTGTHIGCDTSSCGACTILMNGKSIKSCTVLAVQANGKEITTVEGLAPEGEKHALQEGFKADGVDYRFTRVKDAVHNSIHWKLAKSPEVFVWLYQQKHEPSLKGN